jgi:hypothetical protein
VRVRVVKLVQEEAMAINQKKRCHLMKDDGPRDRAGACTLYMCLYMAGNLASVAAPANHLGSAVF